MYVCHLFIIFIPFEKEHIVFLIGPYNKIIYYLDISDNLDSLIFKYNFINYLNLRLITEFL